MDDLFYKNILEQSPFGYSYHRIILDNNDKPIDYEFLELNKAFESITGLERAKIINKRVNDIIPNIGAGEYDWINIYGDIALNGGTKIFEQYSNELNKWFKIYTYSPKKFHFVTVFIDITNEKQNRIAIENFFELNPDLMFIIDDKGNFIKVNKASKSILGYEPPELINKNCIDFIYQEDIEKTMQAFKEMQKSKKLENFTNRYITKEKETIILEWSAQLVDGIIYAAARDITEKVIMDTEYKAIQERYMLAIKGSSNGLWDWDLITNDVFYSPQWKKMLGYEDHELPNNYNTFEDNLHPDDKKRVLDYINDYISGIIDTFSVEFRMKQKDGSFKWILARGEVLFDENNKPYRMAGSHTDITDRKLIEENLRLSHETYKGILDSISEAIYVHDSEGKFRYVNKAVETFYGYDRDYFIGRTPEFLSAPNMNNINEVMNYLQKAFNGAPQLFDFWGIRKDGSIFPKEVSCGPGNYFGKQAIITVARNITERKKLEDTIKESERKYRLIAENSDDVIWIINLEGKFEYISPSIFKIRGVTASEAMQESITDSLPEFWKEKVLFELNSGIEIYKKTNKFPTTITEFELLKKDGSTIWVEVNANGLYNDDNQLIGIIGVSRNIDERKKVESKLIKYAEELEETNKEKDKFFSIIAHDLKAPFSGFLGLTKILATQIQDLKIKEMQEFGQNMQESANNLYKLLENLLDWSKIKRGISDFNLTDFGLNFIVEQNISLFTENIKLKQITILNHINDEYIVFADVSMINAVMRNLISNAVKFTNNNGTIIIGVNSSQSNNNQICVFVKDTGIGMDEEIKSKIFKIDQKVTRFGTNEETGTGLGLLLSKEFIEKHGCSLWFESEENIGTTFYFTLNLFQN